MTLSFSGKSKWKGRDGRKPARNTHKLISLDLKLGAEQIYLLVRNKNALIPGKRKFILTSRSKLDIWENIRYMGEYLGCEEMQSFIVEQLRGEGVDVYCGGPDVFSGRIESCADNVLTLEENEKRTYIAIDKIIAIWRAQ